MTKLTVLEVPHPLLSQPAQKVAKITPEIQQTLSDMLETMYATNGVGLAANQVGILQSMVVIDCANKDETPQPYKMVNPEIIEKSPDFVVHNEGCLSVPREYADVIRHEWVIVRYLDENGITQELKATDLLSIAVQHELDHLKGTLFIDYLSPLKRKMLLKHLDKRRRRECDV